MPGQQRHYQLPPRRSLDAIRARLGRELVLKSQPHTDCLRTYYDTFDWRLYRRGYVLELDHVRHENHGVLRLRAHAAETEILEQPVSEMPQFPADLPDGVLRRKLIGWCKLRALTPLAQVQLQLTPMEVRDPSGKIVVRLADISFHPCQNGADGIYNKEQAPPLRRLHRQFTVQPLRGYATAAEEVQTLVEHELAPEAVDPFDRICRYYGFTPGDYDPRLQLELDPKQPAAQAVAQLLLFLLDVMERNEAGMREDRDIEFLHDFRIACRRSRTLMSQVKQVFPHDELRRFKAAFAWLSRVSGPCRDLDVFWLDLGGLAQQAGVSASADLEVLRDILQSERRVARAQLLRALRSKRYQRFRKDWRELLNRAAGGKLEAPRAVAPVKQVADDSIWRVYRKMVKSGKTAGIAPDVDGNDPGATALHELRKTGKKLRYLLESFDSLYPADEIKDVVKTLKKLQDSLGAIVDASIQANTLQHLATQLDPQAAGSTLRALYLLIHDCDERHNRNLLDFAKRFKRFTAKSKHKTFKRLFKPA